MTTNKRRSRRHDKTKKRDKKEKSRRRHRHRHSHRRHKSHDVSSWKNHYNYESDNDKSTSIINTTNKNDANNGNIVNGLRDFLQGKKDKK